MFLVFTCRLLISKNIIRPVYQDILAFQMGGRRHRSSSTLHSGAPFLSFSRSQSHHHCWNCQQQHCPVGNSRCTRAIIIWYIVAPRCCCVNNGYVLLRRSLDAYRLAWTMLFAVCIRHWMPGCWKPEWRPSYWP